MNVVRHIFDCLERTPQEPKHHPEGNVFNPAAHVLTNVNNHAKSDSFTDVETCVLQVLAVVHDLGKIGTTFYRKDKKRYVAYGHEKASVHYAESFDFLIDDHVSHPDAFSVIFWLVKNHMKPKFELNESTEKELRREADMLSSDMRVWKMLIRFSSFYDDMKTFVNDHSKAQQRLSIRTLKSVVENLSERYNKHIQDVRTDVSGGTLTLVRGLPGSGKTTFVNDVIKPDAMFAADDFFYDEDGEYNFDGSKIGVAHMECQHKTHMAMRKGLSSIAVHNTFVKLWEMLEYYIMADMNRYTVHVITKENRHNGISSHGVSDKQVKRMERTFKMSL